MFQYQTTYKLLKSSHHREKGLWFSCYWRHDAKKYLRSQPMLHWIYFSELQDRTERVPKFLGTRLDMTTSVVNAPKVHMQQLARARPRWVAGPWQIKTRNSTVCLGLGGRRVRMESGKRINRAG